MKNMLQNIIYTMILVLQKKKKMMDLDKWFVYAKG